MTTVKMKRRKKIKINIKNQKKILEFSDAYKMIGITLSESYMMTPKKSVTAIVGIKG